MSDDVDAFGGWLASLGSVETIFDVGANRGQTVARYRRKFPTATLHAFEPGTEAFSLLSKATTGDPNSYCHQLALGATNGVATFSSSTRRASRTEYFQALERR